MEYQEYLREKQSLQKNIIEFTENECLTEEKYENLIQIIDNQQIKETPEKLEEFLFLLSNISNNHNRTNFFIKKIKKLIKSCKIEIKQTFSNSKLFNIFKTNKKILIYLIEEEIITIDESIANEIQSPQFDRFEYFHFFYPEIKSFIDEDSDQKFEMPKEFIKNREIGENDNYICHLIRNDSIDEFISFCNQKNLFLSTQIESSIYETNPFLMTNKPSLIEYSAFFGSIQIFRYLFYNKAKYSPSSLWLYSIHGNNPELFNFLEENNIKPTDEFYKKCLLESIKCHHIDITNYFEANYINNANSNEYKNKVLKKSFKYRNYMFFDNDLNNKNIMFYSCMFNYITIVKFLVEGNHLNYNLMFYI